LTRLSTNNGSGVQTDFEYRFSAIQNGQITGEEVYPALMLALHAAMRDAEIRACNGPCESEDGHL
jgi:hypothetical protein